MTSGPVRLPRVLVAAASLAAAFPLLAATTTAPSTAAPGASTEDRVNTQTLYEQRDPEVAMDADGDYVVVWESLEDYGTLFYGEVLSQRFHADGRPAGGETRVNTTTAGIQHEPTVAMDASGNYVVVWSTDAGAGTDYDVHAQRFTAGGTPSGSQTLVHAVTTGNQTDPSVAMTVSGDYVVSWTTTEAGGVEIRAQRFDSAGLAQGGPFIVNSTAADDQTQSSVAINARGEFVVSWVSLAQDGSGEGVYAQRFGSDGTLRGPELPVNTHTAANQDDPQVAMDADGQFVIVWTSNGQDSSGDGVYFQRYDALGTALGVETRVNSRVFENQFGPAVAMDADGDYRVAWHSFGQDGSAFGVYSQRYDADGGRIGRESRVNLTTSNQQIYPTIAMDADGDHVIAWAGFGRTPALSIFARRFRGSSEVDLSISQSVSPAVVPAGGRTTYRLRVANRTAETADFGIGAIDTAVGVASDVHVVVTPAPGSVLEAVTGSAWLCGSPTTTITCRLTSTLAPRTNAQDLRLTFTAPDEAGPVVQSVEVTGHQADPVVANNADVDSTTVACAIAFSDATYASTEAGPVTATVTRHGTDCGTGGVTFSTQPASAVAGTDFTNVSGTLTWTGAETSKTFTIPVVDDGLDERTELFNLLLSNPTGAVLGTRSLANGSIGDNDDAPRVNYTLTNSTAAEPGALVDLTVQLSEISGQDVPLVLAKAGTATYLSDYFAPKRITIPAGQRTATFTVEVADDENTEANEVAVIALANFPGSSATTLGNQKTYRLTITDDD